MAEVQQGFEALPALWMVLVQLDLMSAYNHVEHTELLHIFAKLKIQLSILISTLDFYQDALFVSDVEIHLVNQFTKHVGSCRVQYHLPFYF